MPRLVTAFSNETVKRLRGLRDKRERRAQGLFLAEGLRILAEARDSGTLPEIVAFSSAGGVHPLAAEIVADGPSVLGQDDGAGDRGVGAGRPVETGVELHRRQHLPVNPAVEALAGDALHDRGDDWKVHVGVGEVAGTGSMRRVP